MNGNRELIRKQDAIDAMKKQRDELLKGLDKNSSVYGIISAVTGIIICIVGQLPSTQQWIPVTERLPEIEKRVLCYVQAGDHFHYIIGQLLKSGKWLMDYHAYLDNVIAWMPLPGPWKGDAE